MDENDIAAIKARLAAITPGPWTQWVEHGSVYAGEITRNEPHCLTGGHTLVAECIDDFDDDGHEVPWEANAAFIAAAPQDIATLLAALEASEQSRAAAKRLVDSVTATRSAWCAAAREEGRASMQREVDALRETNERLTADIEARDAKLARLRSAVASYLHGCAYGGADDDSLRAALEGRDE
jgi:tRNA threonylcarbamoyladenosine modification (KEOPS) complex  Pcc1 subunit